MTRRSAMALLLPSCYLPALRAQAVQDDPIVVSADHPRLFLRPSRLRLLKRERERTSMRWQQFETLIAGNAPMPEPGFARALYYAISGNAEFGKSAIAWALGQPATDLRQLSLVYDWCLPMMSETQQHDLAARMQKRMTETAGDDSIPAVRSRVLAAVALFDEVPQLPQRELERTVNQWWKTKIAAPLLAGRNIIPRDDSYALMELLHALRDTTNLDLRESAAAFFKEFPIEHLMTYYPAAFPGAENEYYIGMEPKAVEPNTQVAALSRVADLAMVAFDVNAPETQVLQGWLMHDKFLLRSTLGSPYEFLWANPYQPGLSYYHVPLIYYNPEYGRLFMRSSWEDTAIWFGHFDGVMQLFSEGRVNMISAKQMAAPVSVGEAMVCFGQNGLKYQLSLNDEDAVFVVGLEPKQTYRVEVDDEEMFEAASDRAGILHLADVPRGKPVGVRLAKADPIGAATVTERSPHNL
jgi:hypothetical protein